MALEENAGGRAMDARFAVASATIFGIVSVLVFIIQPGYVQGLVDLAGLTGQQAGYVASAEMTGYAATVILMSFLSHRLPWRSMLAVCVLVQASGNCICLWGSDVWLLGAGRLVAGLGAGGLSSLSFTAIGLTRNPDREFGFFIMWILAYGAIGLFCLPSLFAVAGLHGFHMGVLIATLASLLLIRFMPARAGITTGEHSEAVPPSRAVRWMANLSIFLFFLACGIFWAYVSLIGDAEGLGAQPVANALSLSQFTGLAGALVAGLAGSRFGRAGPLQAATLLCAVSIAAIAAVDARAALLFGLLVCLFNFAWNVAQPVYLAVASALDREGRLVAQMVASQSCGLAMGPFLGALAGGEQHVLRLIVIVSILFLCAALSSLLLFIQVGGLSVEAEAVSAHMV